MSVESVTETESVSMESATTPRQLNVGPRVDIMTYAHQEWTGNTPTALTILRVC